MTLFERAAYDEKIGQLYERYLSPPECHCCGETLCMTELVEAACALDLHYRNHWQTWNHDSVFVGLMADLRTALDVKKNSINDVSDVSDVLIELSDRIIKRYSDNLAGKDDDLQFEKLMLQIGRILRDAV